MNRFELSSDCTLLRVTASLYSGRAKSKKSAAAAASTYGANVSHINAYLSAFDKEDRMPLQQLVSTARAALNKFPSYDDDGWRMVHNTQLTATMTEIEKIIVEFGAAADAFAARYDELAKKAEIDLTPDLFAELGFPSRCDFRSKFSLHLEQSAIPDADSIKTRFVTPAVHAAIVQAERDRQTVKVDSANKQVAARIITAVKELHDRITKFEKGDAKRYEDSAVTNLSDLLEVVDQMNVTGDPTVKALAAEAREVLASAGNPTPEVVRLDPDVRAKVVGKAGNLLDKIRAGAVKSKI